MSTSLLFGAGAIVTFITLWGVLMASGLFVARRQPSDDADYASVATPIVATRPEVRTVVRTAEAPSSPVPPRLVDG